MDEPPNIRVLSTEEFMRLTPEEKLAYLDAAIRIHVTRPDGSRESDPGPDPPPIPPPRK